MCLHFQRGSSHNPMRGKQRLWFEWGLFLRKHGYVEQRCHVCSGNGQCSAAATPCGTGFGACSTPGTVCQRVTMAILDANGLPTTPEILYTCLSYCGLEVNAAPIVYNTPESKVFYYHCEKVIQNSVAYSDDKYRAAFEDPSNQMDQIGTGYNHALAEEFEVQAFKAHFAQLKGYMKKFKRWSTWSPAA
ncbi:hypothetical protein BJ741DRAFT_576256 [Chytriomyces cf. hyalinus JEL632]|nr:hypothetical protein BJ741DRAFT_576256 [Chytriomyces cf. hyalinus JEL632]